MKFINILADGSVLEDLAGVVVPYCEATASLYESITQSMSAHRPITGRRTNEDLQKTPEADQSRKDSGQLEGA